LEIKWVVGKEIKLIQHRSRISAPEDETVHILRQKRNGSDLPGISGIADFNKPRLQPFKKPLAVKCGDVRSAAATDDHDGKRSPC